MITGVNLGNWLVLEKWMSPELFAGTDARMSLTRTSSWTRPPSRNASRCTVTPTSPNATSPTSQGWFYWNYRLLVSGSNIDGWDMGKSIELGYLPSRLKP